jgi:hypothetical protein
VVSVAYIYRSEFVQMQQSCALAVQRSEGIQHLLPTTLHPRYVVDVRQEIDELQIIAAVENDLLQKIAGFAFCEIEAHHSEQFRNVLRHEISYFVEDDVVDCHTVKALLQRLAELWRYAAHFIIIVTHRTLLKSNFYCGALCRLL